MIRFDLIASIGDLMARQAQAMPDKIAYSDDNRHVTYAALADETARLAAGLRAAGLQPGDRVGIWLANSVDWVVAALATVRAGGVAVPISAESTYGEVEYRLQDAGATFVFAETACAGLLDQLAGPLGRAMPTVILRDQGLPQTAFAAPADLPAEDIHAPAFIVYTSGTTGKPKGVVLTVHSLLWVNAACWAPILGMGADDVLLSPLPLYHSYALNISVTAVLANGASIHIQTKFSPSASIELLQTGRFTMLPGVPTMFHYLLLAAKEKGVARLGNLRRCASAGAILPAALNRDFEARFGVDLLDGYGITETSTMVTMNWPGQSRIAGSCGLPLPGLSVRIIDPVTGLDQPIGDEGELICRGPNLMLGYLNKPEDTARALKDGWYHTGDLARSDNNGFLTITGRLKEIIIRGGQNISPGEVEEALLGHPSVRDCAVVGVPHETLGEVPVAYIVCADQPMQTEVLLDYCKQHLAAYKLPASLCAIDQIPRTGSGKVIRFKLREAYIQNA